MPSRPKPYSRAHVREAVETLRECGVRSGAVEIDGVRFEFDFDRRAPQAPVTALQAWEAENGAG